MTSAHITAAIAAWAVAAVWTARTLPALLHTREIPDLNGLAADCQPEGLPTVTVIVPAKDEVSAIARTLRSLAMQDYGPLHVVAVDDRSEDGTGGRMDAVAQEFPERVQVVHVRTLPAGWAGKIHAVTLGADDATSDFLLFTDGDIYFAPDAVRRAMTMAVRTDADHFVLLPTLRIERWDEGMMLATIQTLGNLAVRLWKVPDPRAKRDALGVGAFTLVRRSAFAQMGGYARRPLEIVEDLKLGQDMKSAGYRSVVVVGRDLVWVHWASGALGIIRTVRKNAFAAVGFRLPFAVMAAVFTLAAFWVPLVGFFVPGLRLPAVVSLSMIAFAFFLNARVNGTTAWYGLLSPLGSAGAAGALLWSTFQTLRQKGIWWRGTFYSLAELRRLR